VTAAPEPSRLPPPPPSTAVEIAADVLVLLRKGRVAPVLAQLETLPRLIQTEMIERVGAASWHAFHDGYERGQIDLIQQITGTARRPAARSPKPGLRGQAAKPKRPPAVKPHRWLAERIADPQLREKAKATLRLSDELLDAVAAGRVGLSPGSWRKLRETLGR
jgi:hypothetical protein